MTIKLFIGDAVLEATLVSNSSTEELVKRLKDGPIKIDMKDYGGMEKVGAFKTMLPQNDMPTNAKPGDLILYQGNAFVIYYAPNSWHFTKLGRIENCERKSLLKILGSGNVSVTLSL